MGTPNNIGSGLDSLTSVFSQQPQPQPQPHGSGMAALAPTTVTSVSSYIFPKNKHEFHS